MPRFLSYEHQLINYIEFLKQSLFKIVRNMQSSIETRGNLCTELATPVVGCR